MNRKHLSILTGLLVGAVLLAPVAPSAGKSVIHGQAAQMPGSLADALTQAQATNKMVVIDFYTDW